MTQTVQAEAVVDISASTGSVFKFKAPRAGKILLNECWARWTEAAGTQTTTAGVASIEVATVEQATITSGKDEAVGDVDTWTLASTVGNDKAVYFAAADLIDVKLKTQAVGGSVTGELRAYLVIELAAV